QGQGVETDRVLGVVFPPFVVRQPAESLQRVIVSLCKAAIDEQSRSARRLGRAQIRRLENGPRSWLSQWSYDLSNAKGPKNAARIRRTPVLQVENLADDAVPASHNPTIRSALATSDKEYVGIEGATHYYQNQPAQLHQCISAVLDWSRRKGLLAG